MNVLTRLSVVLLLAVMIPTEAAAQSQFTVGPRLGIDAGDIEEVFIGGDVRISSPALPVTVNPTFDFYFTPDNTTFWGLSANALYPFGANNQQFTPYSGAGLGLYRLDTSGRDATDLGLNLLFGVEFPLGSLRPFAEAQFTPVFADDSYNLFTVKGGLLFSF